MERMWILSTWTDLLEKSEAVNKVLDWSRQGLSKGVVFCSVHMIMEAYDSKDFSDSLKKIDLVCADGRPLFILQKIFGKKKSEQVYGPHTTVALLERCAEESIPVGFYGGSVEGLSRLIQKVREKYPKLIIAYSYSPPFKELSSEELEQDAYKINSSGAKILFIGLGCPKQERWVASQKESVQMPMLAVGAAFDFISGDKKSAPQWMRFLSLEWLFRLCSEPKRLWRRYLLLNPRFVLLFIWKSIFPFARKEQS